jgi:hypothetical protein
MEQQALVVVVAEIATHQHLLDQVQVVELAVLVS